MTRESGGLRLEDRLRASGELHLALLHRGEGRRIAAAAAAAVALHLGALALPFPLSPMKRAPVPRPAVRRPLEAQALVPGPPETAPPIPRPARPTREVPAATAARAAPAAPAAISLPETYEPVLEPDPEVAPDDLPSDAAILLGAPEPPPAGPAPVQTADSTPPELIPESRVRPVYPQRARQLGVTGSVVLDVSVQADGSVGTITVLRCTPPDVGFCQSATRAVKRWRYRPATRGGSPVQVSVTVKVDFVP